jgi:hypothetical protein
VIRKSIKNRKIFNHDNSAFKVVFLAIEVGHTYGKRRMRVSLNNQGYNIGIYQTATILYKRVCTVLHTLIGVKHQCVGIRLVS